MYWNNFLEGKFRTASICVISLGIAFSPNYLMAQDVNKDQKSNNDVDLLDTYHHTSEETLKDIDKSSKQDKWVEVTRPMISCGANNDDPKLKDLLLDTLIKPS